MSKVTKVKVGGAIGVPTVDATNVTNGTAWADAFDADVASGKTKGEVNFRAYGLFASVVILKVAKVDEIRVATGATEGVDKHGKPCLVGGADKGQISKARKVLLSYVSTETPTADDLAEALELAIADHTTLYNAYTVISGDGEPKPERSWQSKLEAVVKQALAEGASESEIAEVVTKVFAGE
jgi:alkylhydroperoxidase/carboxymuconolactone decarboxylase family protein YurZ